jgi:hypothetical protein
MGNRNEYLIYSKQDVIELLEDGRDLLFEAFLKNKHNIIEDNKHITRISWNANRDEYRWTCTYNTIQVNYFYLSVNKTINLLYQFRKIYNNSNK